MFELKYDLSRNRRVVVCSVTPKLFKDAAGDAKYRNKIHADRGCKSSASLEQQTFGSILELCTSLYFNIAHESRRLTLKQWFKWNYDWELADVGRFECKATSNPKGHLKIPEKYSDDSIGILGYWNKYNRTMTTVGWQWVRKCKDLKYVQGDRFWVPQGDLRCMSQLSPIRDAMLERDDNRWKYPGWAMRRNIDAAKIKPLPIQT